MSMNAVGGERVSMPGQSSSKHSKFSFNPFSKNPTKNTAKVPTPNQVKTADQVVGILQERSQLRAEHKVGEKRLVEYQQNIISGQQETAAAQRDVKEGQQKQVEGRQKRVEGHQVASQTLDIMINKLNLQLATLENVANAENARKQITQVLSQFNSLKIRLENGEDVEAELTRIINPSGK